MQWMTVVLVVLLLCLKHSKQKQVGVKAFISTSSCLSKAITGEGQGRNSHQERNLDAGIETEPMKEPCSLACTQQLSQLTILHSLEPAVQG